MESLGRGGSATAFYVRLTILVIHLCAAVSCFSDPCLPSPLTIPSSLPLHQSSALEHLSLSAAEATAKQCLPYTIELLSTAGTGSAIPRALISFAVPSNMIDSMTNRPVMACGAVSMMCDV